VELITDSMSFQPSIVYHYRKFVIEMKCSSAGSSPFSSCPGLLQDLALAGGFDDSFLGFCFGRFGSCSFCAFACCVSFFSVVGSWSGLGCWPVAFFSFVLGGFVPVSSLLYCRMYLLLLS
jgi:hypothetical protein